MRAVIITVFDSETGSKTDYTFAKSAVRIGRNPLNDLALSFPFVSGWHAVVRYEDDKPRFYDLGSTNGTLHDGRRVVAGEPVDIGQMLSVTIGKLELRFRPGEEVSVTQSGSFQRATARRRGTGFETAALPAVVDPTSGVPSPAPSVPMTTPTGTVRRNSPYPATPPGAATRGDAGPSVPPPGRQGPTPGPTPGPAPASPSAYAPPTPGQHAPRPAAPPPAAAPPVASPRPAGDRGTDLVDMGAVHDAIPLLRPHYEAYQRAWNEAFNHMREAVERMPLPVVPLAISLLSREFPAVLHQPEFLEFARRHGAPVAGATGGAGGTSQEVMGAVRTMSQQLRPHDSPPESPAEAERFLASVSEVMRVAAGALVELQNGQEQFGAETGVRVIMDHTPVREARTADEVLAYLLDWQRGGPQRIGELRGVYADLMMHQIALVRGVVEGARAILTHLDPTEIERGVNAWTNKSAAAWKQYGQTWQELRRDDRRLMGLLFGPLFARAYAEAGGEGQQ